MDGGAALAESGRSKHPMSSEMSAVTWALGLGDKRRLRRSLPAHPRSGVSRPVARVRGSPPRVEELDGLSTLSPRSAGWNERCPPGHRLMLRCWVRLCRW